MRLRTLWLAGYKNLRNVTVAFDSDHAVSVVVGHNGTGKSNLLEALTEIFRDLDLGDPPGFEYSLAYECRGRVVQIDAEPSARQRLRVRVDGIRVSQAQLRGEAGPRYLPDFVFGYYSGPSDRLQRHFQKHQDNFNRALREGGERPLRRLFYALPTHSQFVLLAFFLDSDPAVGAFLRNYLRILDLESVLFVLREPPWTSRTGDPRFWNARGVVAELLDELHSLALAPMRRIDTTLSKSLRREHIYLYLSGIDVVRELAGRYGNRSQELFKAFESILAADLLSEVRVRVQAQGLDDSLVFRELSEGEQQLLMVLGLLRFTREEESLFLLDEPDTHLNPAWSVRYTEMLEQSSGSGRASSQLLMVTHDPLVIAGLVREQVTILDRNPATGLVFAERPEQDPRGMGVAGLLTSDIYDLASELDTATLNKLERRRWLAAAEPGELSSEEKEELGQLTDELEKLDFNFTTRDPLYTEFERAMASLERVDRPVLNRQESDEERNKSERVLRNLLEDESASEGNA